MLRSGRASLKPCESGLWSKTSIKVERPAAAVSFSSVAMSLKIVGRKCWLPDKDFAMNYFYQNFFDVQLFVNLNQKFFHPTGGNPITALTLNSSSNPQVTAISNSLIRGFR